MMEQEEIESQDVVKEAANKIVNRKNRIIAQWTERIGLILITVVLTSFGSFYTLRTIASSSKLDQKANIEYVDKQIKDLKDDFRLLMQQNQSQHEDILRRLDSSIQLVSQLKCR